MLAPDSSEAPADPDAAQLEKGGSKRKYHSFFGMMSLQLFCRQFEGGKTQTISVLKMGVQRLNLCEDLFVSENRYHLQVFGWL